MTDNATSGVRAGDNGHWVLVTEGGSGQSRAAVAAVRALRRAGYRPAVTVSGSLSLAGTSRSCLRRVQVPLGESDPEGYAHAVRAELARQDYLAVFHSSDTALLALNAPVRQLIDKESCAKLAASVGMAVPPSQIFDTSEELLASASQLDYPIVVKPVIKRYLAARVDSAGELPPVAARGGRVVVQPYLPNGMHGISGLMWQGELLAAVHLRYWRVWPAPCGTIASGETVPIDAELEEHLAALLRGYNGVFHADFAGPYLLDLNPRIHASLPVTVAAGVNLVVQYCDLLRGVRVPPSRGKPGFVYRWVEGDVRSIIWSLRRGKLGPWAAFDALRPRRGVVHSFASFTDPAPARARVVYAVRRLKDRRKPRPDLDVVASST